MAYYFAEFKTTKSNVNKFLINLLMAPFTKKFFYENADKLMEKLSEITWDILEDKKTEYEFNLESGVSRIVW